MANPSTCEIVSLFLRHIVPTYRTIRDVEGFQREFPLRTVIVMDENLALSQPLPDEYSEYDLYLMKGATQLATLYLGFHKIQGMVNCSMFLVPREWFKRRAVMNCLKSSLFPFLRQNYPNAKLIRVTPQNYLFPDPESGLTFQVRTYLDSDPLWGLGIAVIDSDHV